MTKRPHPTTVAAWALMLMFVLGSLTGSPMAVLCIGADGHTDVETAFEDCCRPSTTTNRSEAGISVAASGDSCNNCADIELTVDTMRSQRRQLAPVENAHIRSIGDVSPRSSLPTTETSPNQHWRCLAAISTVVLLT